MAEHRRTIRIATFNVENLFSRLAFADDVPAEDRLVGNYQFDDPAELKLARRIVEAAASDDKRQLTALALHAAQADVVCLQEVDNKEALEVFYQRYLKRLIEPAVAAEKRQLRQEMLRNGRQVDPAQLFSADKRHYYDWRVVVDGNDGRGIDVGVMSKLPVSVRTHAHRTFQELGVWNDELRGYRDRSAGRERRLCASRASGRASAATRPGDREPDPRPRQGPARRPCSRPCPRDRRVVWGRAGCKSQHHARLWNRRRHEYRSRTDG